MVTKQQIIQELQEKRFSESILNDLIKNSDYWRKFSENDQTEEFSDYEKKEILNSLFDYIERTCSSYDDENWSIDNEGFVIFNQQRKIFHKNELVPEKRNSLERHLTNCSQGRRVIQQIIQNLQVKKLIESNLNDILKGSHISKDGWRQISQVIFENIMRNSEGWKIKQIHEILSGAPYAIGGNEKIHYLVHDSAKIRYDNEGLLITDPQKLIRKNQFTEQQWSWLERNLVQSQHLEQPKPTWWFRWGGSKY